MLDLDPGIVLPNDINIFKYKKDTWRDVIEKQIQYMRDLYVLDDIGLHINNREREEYVVEMAIKHNMPELVLELMRRYRSHIQTITRYMLKYDAVDCMRQLLPYIRDTSKNHIWNAWEPNGPYPSKRMLSLYTTCIDQVSVDWLIKYSKCKDMPEVKQMLIYLVRNISLQYILKNIHTFYCIADIVFDVYGGADIVKEMVLNPYQALDEFISYGLRNTHRPKDQLEKYIDIILKDIDVFNSTLENIISMKKHELNKYETYKHILSHKDIVRGLDIYGYHL